jgi:hypothetical protein
LSDSSVNLMDEPGLGSPSAAAAAATDVDLAAANARAPLRPVHAVVFARMARAIKLHKHKRATINLRYVCIVLGSDAIASGKTGEALAALLADDDIGFAPAAGHTRRS